MKFLKWKLEIRGVQITRNFGAERVDFSSSRVEVELTRTFEYSKVSRT